MDGWRRLGKKRKGGREGEGSSGISLRECNHDAIRAVCSSGRVTLAKFLMRSASRAVGLAFD